MRVDNGITVYAGTGQDNAYIARTDKTDSANEERKTLFAGDMQKGSGLPGLQDRIQQKKEKAQKQALRIVSRAWDNDRKVDDELNRRRQHVLDLRQSSKEAQEALEDIAKQKKLVQQAYNIADDSQEQQDLEYFTKLKKYVALGRLTDEYNLTSEERDRVDEMFGGEAGFEYTEYQRRQLQLAGQSIKNEEIILRNNKNIKREKEIIEKVSSLGVDEVNRKFQYIDDMEQQNKVASSALIDIEKQSGEIKKEYGIEDDSQEQQDLNFYIKSKKYLALAQLTKEYDLTTEEQDRLEGQLAGKGGFEYTEYQSKQLGLVGDEIQHEKVILQNRKDIIEENYIIRGIKEERRKVHPIIDAQKKADTIMEAAGKDIIGMVVDEAKEHVDEEQEEQKEKAEAAKEKKEEQEELLDKRKEEKEEMVELAEALLSDQPIDLAQIQSAQRNDMEDIANKAGEVALEVQKLFDDMDLLVEDIKGTMVDLNL